MHKLSKILLQRVRKTLLSFNDFQNNDKRHNFKIVKVGLRVYSQLQKFTGFLICVVNKTISN